MRRAGLVGVPRVRPWSWQAFLLGFIVVAVSAALQGVCVALGAKLYFAAFLPSLFVLGIVAGAPAAVFAALLTVPLVWWAFIPPFFQFMPLSSAGADSINLFCLLAVLLIGLADLCRETMAMISRGGLKPSGESTATNSQEIRFGRKRRVAPAQQSGNHPRAWCAPLTFRKRFGRNFSPGNDEGVFEHERSRHL